MKHILVTGGAGYIGSHVALALLEAGWPVVIVDDLSAGHREAVRRIEKLTKKDLVFYPIDAADRKALSKVFSDHKIASVIHFAGKKSVKESVQKPLDYYRTNLYTTLALCDVMQQHDVTNFVFSSSATVYGQKATVPYDETQATGDCASPYAWSKWMNEKILFDVCEAHAKFSVVSLRYFNPVGAHSSGMIGEDPKGVPENLFPYLLQVVAGKRDELNIYGHDYPTPDGTGVRDYIHVVDLAEGHIRALDTYLDKPGFRAINLGTGKGYSVLDVVHAFSDVIGRPVPYRLSDRRDGDLPSYYADTALSQKVFDFQPQYDLGAMVKDAWHWQNNNPDGYEN